ncbi:MAG: in-like serine protease [Bacteroidetes bacterium]|jgi:subtilisin family serine protease|nr:in-like serine protease [Bacteroidota bacterium]
MKRIFILASLFFTYTTFAQKAPENWFNLDPATNKVNGVGTERTYEELLKGKKSKTIIVGVIDSGVDFNHEDLKEVMWTNEKEVPGNGVDDDKNGYIDDIHGWSFLGGKDGKNVDHETLELTRIYRELKPKYDGKTEKDIDAKSKEEFALYLKAKEDFEAETNEANQNMMQIAFIQQLVESMNLRIKNQLSVEKVGPEELAKFKAEDAQQKQLLPVLTGMVVQYGDLDSFLEKTEEGSKHFEDMLTYNLNLEFDPRYIIGDDYKNQTEKYYGNADCNGPSSLHGTHVAGIIAAKRNNNVGINGVADNVKIMAIRAVPNGDERDKDIANAIYYAVDNGASVINMSFGKKYSYNKKIVDDAVKYAESKDVLIVHAAGNEALNIDEVKHYPCKQFEGTKKEAKNFMDVGASSWKPGEKLPAEFSNYGKKTVDVFAPGVDIYSTNSGGGYINESGTSMACPVTAGVAAVLRSYFPDLSAQDIKKILTKSVNTDYKKEEVQMPGTLPAEDGKQAVKVKFAELSKTGGLVNMYNAVQMAMKMSKVKL